MKSLNLSDKTITRLLLALVIVLSLVSGMLGEELRQKTLQYNRLEDMFVRVRSQLGRTEMQRLIDQSYEVKK